MNAKRKTEEKIHFLLSELSYDLGIQNWRRLRGWIHLFVFSLFVYVSAYSQCVGRYATLRMLGVVVDDLSAGPMGCYAVYAKSNIDLNYELRVTMGGPAFNLTLFCMFMGLAVLYQKYLGVFPEWLSVVMLCWGLVCVLTCPFTVLRDFATENWRGDTFRLYYLMIHQEGSDAGFLGILTTLLLAGTFTVVASLVFYVYLLHIHRHGSIMDYYRRLHGGEKDFRIPNDMEISSTTLRWVILEAKRWKGFQGQSKIIETRYHRTVDHITGETHTWVHLAISIMTLKGEREPFRHFVRQPDGTILEIFGRMPVLGQKAYKDLETNLRKIMASPVNLDDPNPSPAAEQA